MYKFASILVYEINTDIDKFVKVTILKQIIDNNN